MDDGKDERLDNAPRPRRLVVSIHDVSPAFDAPVERLAGQLETLLGGPRFAMLVVPDHWGRAPLGRSPAFCRRLRAHADAGVEMFLHGWLHRDTMDHADRWTALRATVMTAREGEFLGLSADESERRMRDGRDVVEQAIGRPCAGFIAPAWLYGPGAHEAMHRVGFALAEDHWRVWRPADDSTVAHGPVVTWASRSRWRTASSLAVAALARAVPGGPETVRVAVHPGDVSKPSLIDSIERTVRALASRRVVSRYADLTPPVPLELAA